MKKVLSLSAAVLTIAMLFTGCTGTSNKQFALATGGTSGTYYAFGGALASLWNSKIEGMNVTAQTTGASKENCRFVDDRTDDFAIVQNDVMDYAFHGTDMFDGEVKSNLTAIGTLYPEVVQIAVSKSSGIKSVADFKGKRVSVGASGSGVEFNAKQIMAAYGLTFDDIIMSNLSFAESSAGIQNGTLDACFITAGVPNPALVELAVATGLELIPVTGAEAAATMAKYGYYTPTTIPAGTYKGTDVDTPALAIQATLIANKDVDTETVYQLTKTMFENLGELGTLHAKGKEVSAESAIQGISIPFHPGAAKYYKEIGLMN